MNKARWIGDVGNMNFKEGEKNGRQWQYLDFSIAQVDQRANKTFINCKTWSKTVIDTIKEGDLIELVNYTLQNSSWTNSSTGAKNYRTTIIVEEIVMIEAAELIIHVEEIPSDTNSAMEEESPPAEDMKFEWED